MNTIESDKRFLGRDIPAAPIEISGAKGSYLYGPRGEEYIDFLMGWNVGNIGWNQEEVNCEIRKFAGPNYINPNYLYQPWSELAELLAKVTPGNLEKSFRVTGGTEAVETALQAAMTYTKRSKFLSIEGSYHGHSIGAMSVGMSDFRSHYSNLLPGCLKLSVPLDGAKADEAEEILKSREIAAIIMEPIICNLGVVMPEQEFFDKIAKACRKYGTLLIIDEVATGFGRTGKFFASEWYGLEPDIMCLGKAISGGYGAIGATIMTPEVAHSMEYDFSVYSTFGWHPINTIATLANLKYLLGHKLWEPALLKEKYFKDKLEKIDFRSKPEIRIKGLAIGLEFGETGYATELMKKSMKNGLLFADLGPNIVTFFPALNIDDQTIDKGLAILERSAEELG